MVLRDVLMFNQGKIKFMYISKIWDNLIIIYKELENVRIFPKKIKNFLFDLLDKFRILSTI